MNGTDLLAEFRATGSEHAFSEVVRRYTNLVYSVAKRRLSNTALAQDATQTVFIRLAKAAPNIRGDAELVAWLHRTTVNASIDLWRSESRRRAREEHAVAMQSDRTESPVWNEIAPAVDEVLNELNTQERQVLLLRFFEQKSMREVGLLLGISEDAAKMRVSRALDRLRGQLAESGVTCSAIALAPLLLEQSVEAAPSGLILRLAAIRLPVVAGAGAAVGIGSMLVNVSKAKVVAAISAAVLLSTVALFLFNSSREHSRGQSATPAVLGVATQDAENASLLASRTSDSSVAQIEDRPDPSKLLQGVIRARQRIWSGEMEFQSSSYQSQGENLTNHARLRAFFDGAKRRFESFAREYGYVSAASEGVARETAQIRERRLDREAAVRAGLLRAFESRHVTAFDGVVLLDYWETDGKPEHATIDDPSRGTPQAIFDPRLLGLDAALSSTATLEEFGQIMAGKSLTLIDQESVEGLSAWHVRAQSGRMVLEFWIDVANTNHVLKQKANNGITITSRFDDTHPQDPLPVEVRIASYSFSTNGLPRSETWIVRTSARINVPVDPASWTLAGLGIQVGTAVIDTRIYRQIGYWTGAGLSEDFPRKEGGTQSPPDHAELLAILDSEPGSALALETARWILLNTPDGSDVEKAAELIIREHIRSTNLVSLTVELERMRHHCSRKLLEAMVEKNPNTEIRGNACFTLAVLRKDEAKYGKNKQATGEAEKLFQRVISEFSRVKRNGAALADLAKPELAELRNLTIGKTAPGIEGQDLEGEPMRLSEYRGKVLLLLFWDHCCLEADDLNKLADQISGRPAAIVGINCDRDLNRARADVETNHVTWPSFWDGRDGPICTAWNVNSWPTTFVVDRKGVIRYRNVRQGEMGQAVEALLKE